jgi:uncharacterized protein YndB with AHSA1/START domain
VGQPQRQAEDVVGLRRPAEDGLDLPLGAGLRRQPQTADIEIVEFDRPKRFAFAITQHKRGSTKDVRYRHTFVLTPEGGGTRLERTTASVGGNPLLDFIVTPAVKADGKKSLANLKEKVEASA